MAITQHKHTNDTGHTHVFQVDSDRGTVHLVKPDGKLQFSSTNIDPILALPRVDSAADIVDVPQPELAQPVAIAPEAEPVEEAAPKQKKGKA